MARRPTLKTFSFTIILSGITDLTDDLMDEVCGKVLKTGCDDASLHSAGDTLYLSFDREAADLGDAVGSAIKAVEKAGLNVGNIEIDPVRTDGTPPSA